VPQGAAEPWEAGSPLEEAAWDDAGGEADTFVYDELDRVTARAIAGVGTLYFEYDLAGRRTLIKDWEGKAVYYAYDSRGLIASVHSHAGWAHYTYDARGAVLTRQLPNGSCTYYAYDAAGRVTRHLLVRLRQGPQWQHHHEPPGGWVVLVLRVRRHATSDRRGMA